MKLAIYKLETSFNDGVKALRIGVLGADLFYKRLRISSTEWLLEVSRDYGIYYWDYKQGVHIL